jgi:hypothetical protein
VHCSPFRSPGKQLIENKDEYEHAAPDHVTVKVRDIVEHIQA